jgi:hypothetical protein
MFSLFSFQFIAAIRCRTRQLFAIFLFFSQGMTFAWLMVLHFVHQDDYIGSLKQIADQPSSGGMSSALSDYLS